MRKLCKPTMVAVGMAITCIIIYSNSLHCPFVFDDIRIILENPHIRLSEFNLRSILEAFQSPAPRPIANFSFALNYFLGGYNLAGYHIVNILIHVVSGILLFFFIRVTLSFYITDKQPSVPSAEQLQLIAFFTAFIWLVNPLHTNSVTYIVQRMNSLGALFYLASFMCYIKGRKMQISRPSRSDPKQSGNYLQYLCFVGALIFWFFAVGSKENNAILPVIIFFYEWFFIQKLNWNITFNRNLFILFLTCSFIIVFGGYLIVTKYTGIDPIFERLSILYKSQNFTLSQRMFTEFRVLIYYISLIFFPHPSRLNLDYNYPISDTFVHPITTLACFTVIVALFITAIFYARKDRLLSFAIVWFFGNLFIESSFIPLVPIFEHRTYLPSMFIILLLPVFLFRYVRVKWFNISFLTFLLIILSIWTFQRNAMWENDITLWKDSVRKSPDHARSLNHLGRSLLKKNKSEQAVGFLKKAIEISPLYIEAINNLGVAYYNLRRFDQSINMYERSLEINAEDIDALNNMGNALLKLNKADQAIPFFLKAKKMDPRFLEASVNLGNALIKLNRYDEAIEQFSQIIEQYPDYFEAYVNLGAALIQKKQFKEALINFQKALGINPKNAELHNNMGIILIRTGDFAGALYHFQQALEINPNYVSAKNNMNKLQEIIQSNALGR